MSEKYLSKKASEFSSTLTGNYKKPSICPYCGMGVDAPILKKDTYALNSGHRLLVANCRCTSCEKIFFFTYEYCSDAQDFVPVTYPSVSFTPYSNEILETISPRFIDMYNQALLAEFNSNYELAAIGYRSALEFLIKDYAINELGKKASEVSSKKLCDSIGIYLHQEELVKTADVVRILGNDFTHYQRKYPEHDFKLLKKYMDIFLSQVEAQYMIMHPPVSRTP